MKNKSGIVLLLVAVVLVIAAVLVINSANKPGDDINGESGKDATFYDLETKGIVAAAIENSGGKYSFAMGNAEVAGEMRSVWKYTTDMSFPDDSDLIYYFLSSYRKLVAKKTVFEKLPDAENLEFCGLGEKPLGSLELHLSDGTVDTLLFGRITTDKAGMYCMIKGETKIYIISKPEYDVTAFSPGDIMKKKIFPMSEQEFTYFYLWRDGKVRLNSYIEGSVAAEDYEWIITEPIQVGAGVMGLGYIFESLTNSSSGDKGYNDILSLLYVNPTEEQLTECGLDSPKYIFRYSTLSDAEGEYTEIKLGKYTTSKDGIYGIVTGTNRVCIFDPEKLNFLDKNEEQLLDSYTYMDFIDKCDEVVFTVGEERTKFILKHDPTEKEGNSANSEFFVMIDDKEVEITKLNEKGDNTFRTFYQSIIGLSGNEFILDSNYILPDDYKELVEVSLLYKRNVKPRSKLLEFISMDDNYYYVIIDGVFAHMKIMKNNFSSDSEIMKTFDSMF